MKDVYITGIAHLGAVPGENWQQVFDNACAGKNAFRDWPESMSRPSEHSQIGLVKWCPKEKLFTKHQLRLMSKSRIYGSVATGLVLEDAAFEEDYEHTHTALYTGSNRCEITDVKLFSQGVLLKSEKEPNPPIFMNISRNIFSGQISLTHQMTGWSSHIGSGTSSGLHAVERGVDTLALERGEVAVCGAVECLSKAALLHTIVAGENHLQQEAPKFFSNQDDAARFVPAEGASFLCLETKDSMEKRNKEAYAKISASQSGQLGKSNQNYAEVYAKIITNFLARNNLSKQDIALVCASQSGAMHFADIAERDALQSIWGEFTETQLSFPKKIFGEAESCSGVMMASVAAMSLKTNKLLCANSAETELNASAKYALVSFISLSGSYTLMLLEKV